MKQTLLLGLIIFGLISCNSKPIEIREETNYTSESADLKSVLKSFRTISKKIKNVYNRDTTKLELYIQMSESDKIKKVQSFNDSIGSYYSSYNLIRNKSGQIIYIAEFPSSESGDWNLIYENYFDSNGNLIAFVRKCSFFNGECAEIVHEKSEYIYNSRHELIKKTYEISDGDKKPLDFKKCVFNYRYDYKKFLTIKEYLKNYKFE
jgi:hypothetical protein